MPEKFARDMPASVPAVGRQSAPLQFFVDDLFEEVERLRAADHAAVDEEGRRAIDAPVLAGAQVGVDLRLFLVRVDARVELRLVEPEFGGGLLQIGGAQ